MFKSKWRKKYEAVMRHIESEIEYDRQQIEFYSDSVYTIHRTFYKVTKMQNENILSYMRMIAKS